MKEYPKRIQTKSIVTIVTILATASLVLVMCAAGIGYVTNQWWPSYDARVVQLGICLTSDLPLKIVDILPDTLDQVYICGHVEGTTILPVSITLFNEDEFKFQVNETLKPGDFFVELQPWKFDVSSPTGQDYFYPGQFRIRISRMRGTVAEAEFTVNDE